MITADYPKVSYHGGHSHEFCDHAPEGSSLKDMIDRYLVEGFRHFGITEHQPRTSGFLYKEEKDLHRTPESLDDTFDRYMQTARALQKDWTQHDSFHMLVGFETEMCGDNPIQEIIRLREKHQPDYIVGSVHHVGNIPTDFDKPTFDQAVAAHGGMDNLVSAYFDLQFRLITGVQPEVIGHIDLIKKYVPDLKYTSVHLDKIVRNIKAVKEYGGVIEINSRALYNKNLAEPYPGRQILKLISQMEGLITFGDDSHYQDEVGKDLGRAAHVAREFFDHIVVFEMEKGILVKRFKDL